MIMKNRAYRHTLLGVGLLVSVAGLPSCSSNGGISSTFVQASGRPGEVMIVINNEDNATPAGGELKGMLEAPALSLPQIEKSFDVSTVPHAAFTDFVRYFRNIVIVDKDPERYSVNSLKYSYDEWAKGQLVLSIQTPSMDSLRTYVANNAEAITNMIARHELFRLGQVLQEEYSQVAVNLIDSVFAHRVNVPKDIRSSKVGKDFVWLSNNTIRKRHDILVYSFPYTSRRSIEQAELVRRRDSVLKANIQGEFENSYPATEQEYGLVYRKVSTDAGGMRGELRGLWKMEGGSMMGGPFVSQAYVDEQAGKVYVVEGFVYHPNEDKLGLVRVLESSLYSFRPKGLEKFDPKDILTANYTKFTK